MKIDILNQSSKPQDQMVDIPGSRYHIPMATVYKSSENLTLFQSSRVLLEVGLSAWVGC